MPERADTRMPELDVASRCLRPFEEFIEVVRRQRRPRRERRDGVVDEADRHEVLDRVESEIRVERHAGRERILVQQDRVAVRLGARGARSRDHAAGAADVLDHDRLVERLLERRLDDARDGVVDAAGRECDEHRDGTGRIGLRRGGTGGKKARGKNRERAEAAHESSLDDLFFAARGRAASRRRKVSSPRRATARRDACVTSHQAAARGHAAAPDYGRDQAPVGVGNFASVRRSASSARHAALIDCRKRPTSSRNRALSRASDRADVSISDEAAPVSLAPSVTLVMPDAASLVPTAASRMLRDMSPVAALCSSTAAAIAAEISEICWIVPLISLIAATESCVALCMPAICVEMSPVALAVCAASALTSWATTAKPRPASPARAASMVALSASRLVCSAIAVISWTTSPMRLAAADSSFTRASVFSACATASAAIWLDFCTCRPISAIEEVISSVAAATAWTLVEAVADAALTPADISRVISAVRVSVVAVASSSPEADETVSMIPPTARSNSPARPTMSLLRCAAARASVSFCSLSSLRCAMALPLKTSIALATRPSSSRRPAPGISTSRLPEARSDMAAVMALTGFTRPRASR